MLTLTHRHGAGDDLRHQLKSLKTAKQRLRQRKEWRKLKPFMVGTITATEVTHGSAGWHTHFHEIIIFRAGRTPDPKKDESRAVAVLSRLAPVWVACLRGQGLTASRNGRFRFKARLKPANTWRSGAPLKNSLLPGRRSDAARVGRRGKSLKRRTRRTRIASFRPCSRNTPTRFGEPGNCSGRPA